MQSALAIVVASHQRFKHPPIRVLVYFLVAAQVASALVLQNLFVLCPEARGDLSADDRAKIREEWYSKMWAGAKTAEVRDRHIPFLSRASAGELPQLLEDLRRSADEKESNATKQVLLKMQQRLGDEF